MSDTPETDDIARGNHVVPTEWAQQLERERDEARNVLEEISLYLSSGIGDKNTTAQQYKERILDGIKHLAGHAWEERCKFERERDDAREVLKRIAHASMSARHREEDYAEWEKAVESLQGICEEKNFINE